MTALATQRLADAEHVIAAGLRTFVEVGNALRSIRDERLYADDYPTFEAYCEGRWGFTDRRARQIIDSASIAAALPTGSMFPVNERQAAELTGLAPEVAAEVMETAAESGPLTAAGIRDARAKVTGTPQPTRPADWTCDCGKSFTSPHTHCPTCGDHYPAPATCPDHVISVDVVTGEVLDGPSGEARKDDQGKSRRRPLPVQIESAGWELERSMERVQRLAKDDRFASHMKQVAPSLRSHLTNTIEVCQDLLDRINLREEA